MLSEEAEIKVIKARETVDKALKGKRVIYGLTTGFGALSDVVISKNQTKQLQRNILMSHAAGVGNYLDEEITRAALLLKLIILRRAMRESSRKTLKTLVAVYNKGVCPLMPEKGSVGSKRRPGPLWPTWRWFWWDRDLPLFTARFLSGKDAMKKVGIPLVELDAGEGLALINGTQVMTAIGALTVYDALNLLKTADIAAGMSLEVLLASNIELDKKIHDVRPHPGQIISADNLRRITKKSEIVSSHKDCTRVQDAYSIRCSPSGTRRFP